MKANTMMNQSKSLFSTKQMVTISLLSALAYVLMLIHLPFKPLGFLEVEFSNIPALIAALTYGPFAGVIVELVKNLIKAITASTTGMVGELANFLISSAYIIPAGLLYRLHMGGKRKAEVHKAAVETGRERSGRALYLFLVFGISTAAMTAAGALLNYYVMLPLYAKVLGGMDVIVGIAAGSVPAVQDLASLILLGITPFNIFKGIYISVIGYYTYRMLRGKLLN